MNTTVGTGVKRATLTAVVIRADGRREELGEVGFYDPSWWRRALWRIGYALRMARWRIRWALGRQ